MADIHRDRQRDAAGIGPYARDDERLVPLSELGHWDVAEGEPDIRGWEVRTIGGRELGKVKELLVDPDAHEVVMIDVDLSGNDQHAQVPLRIVEIDRARRLVRMDSADLTPAEREALAEAEDKDHPVRERVARDRSWADTGRVRYAAPTEEERVIERHPIVEEVVVRRRVVDEKEAEAAAKESARRPAPEDEVDRAD